MAQGETGRGTAGAVVAIEDSVTAEIEKRIHARLRMTGQVEGSFEELVAEQARDYARAACRVFEARGRPRLNQSSNCFRVALAALEMREDR